MHFGLKIKSANASLLLDAVLKEYIDDASDVVFLCEPESDVNSIASLEGHITARNEGSTHYFVSCYPQSLCEMSQSTAVRVSVAVSSCATVLNSGHWMSYV